jgi:putative membrane protein
MNASAVVLLALVLPGSYLSAQSRPVSEGIQAAAEPGISDGRALALLAAIHEHEVAIADMLQGRQLSAAVRAYSERLDREHTEQLSVTTGVASKSGISPQQTADVVAYESGMLPARERLEAMPAESFERGYVKATVRGHADLLRALDQDLIPSASDPAVLAHLRATRDIVAAQLAEGRALSVRLAEAD